MLLEVVCRRSVNHDARVSDSKRDGHWGCVEMVSVLIVSAHLPSRWTWSCACLCGMKGCGMWC